MISPLISIRRPNVLLPQKTRIHLLSTLAFPGRGRPDIVVPPRRERETLYSGAGCLLYASGIPFGSTNR